MAAWRAMPITDATAIAETAVGTAALRSHRNSSTRIVYSIISMPTPIKDVVIPPAIPTSTPSFMAEPSSILGMLLREQISRFLASVRMAKLIHRQENSSLMTVLGNRGATQNVPIPSPAAAPTLLQIKIRDWIG